MHIAHAAETFTGSVKSLTGRTDYEDAVGYSDGRTIQAIGDNDFATKAHVLANSGDSDAYVEGMIAAGTASPFNIAYNFGTNPTVVVLTADPDNNTKKTNRLVTFLWDLNFTDSTLTELASIDIYSAGTFEFDTYYKISI